MSSRLWLVAMILVMVLVYQVAPLLPVAPSLLELSVHLAKFVEAIAAHVVVDKARLFFERWRKRRRNLLMLAREITERGFQALRGEIKRFLNQDIASRGTQVGRQITCNIKADKTLPKHKRLKLLDAVEQTRQQISVYIDNCRVAGYRDDAIVELAAYKFRDILLTRIEDALSQRDPMSSILPLRGVLDAEATRRRLRRCIERLCDNVRRRHPRSSPAFVRRLRIEAGELYPMISKETLVPLIDGAVEDTTGFISKNIRGRRVSPKEIIELSELYLRHRLLTAFENYHASTRI